MKNKPLFHITLPIIMALASPSMAGVGKVSSPGVEKGEFEVEYNARRYDDDRASKNNAQKHALEFEYGFTDRWMLGLELIAERNTASQFGFEAYGAETQYQMTNQGDWWLSSALKAEYAVAQERTSADEGEFKLLLQRNEGAFRTTANINFTRQIGDHRDGGVGFETALQTIYRCNAYVSPGLEWHAEYGKIDHLNSSDDQEHYLGPVLKGALFTLGEGDVGYEAGYYWGLTHASADHAQRFKINYEINF